MEIIFSAGTALLVQWIKKNFKTSEYQTLGVVLAVSIIAAALYTALVATGYWESFVGILVSAGAIYTYIIARFE